jgi:hypothetical protein
VAGKENLSIKLGCCHLVLTDCDGFLHRYEPADQMIIGVIETLLKGAVGEQVLVAGKDDGGIDGIVSIELMDLKVETT